MYYKAINGLHCDVQYAIIFTSPYSLHVTQFSLLLPPTNEVWGEVIVLYLSVILFTRGGSTPPGRYTPWAGTHPLGGYTPPGRVHTPWTGTPPWAGTPPDNACCDTVNILLECILVILIYSLQVLGCVTVAPCEYLHWTPHNLLVALKNDKSQSHSMNRPLFSWSKASDSSRNLNWRRLFLPNSWKWAKSLWLEKIQFVIIEQSISSKWIN